MKNIFLTVLDYHSGRVYQTDLTEHFTDEQLHEGVDIENFLWECEFETNNCHWMTGEYINLEKF